jgi:hypothetical protein
MLISHTKDVFLTRAWGEELSKCMYIQNNEMEVRDEAAEEGNNKAVQKWEWGGRRDCVEVFRGKREEKEDVTQGEDLWEQQCWMEGSWLKKVRRRRKRERVENEK